MDNEPFDRWYASYLGRDEKQVAALLQDKLSVYFLLAASILESTCFAGQMSADKIHPYAQSADALTILDTPGTTNAAEFFHTHYRNGDNYRHLMHKEKSAEFKKLIDTDYKDLTKADLVFLLLFVIYRFRHNMFNGEQGVRTWLKLHFEIELCTLVMQALISAANHKA